MSKHKELIEEAYSFRANCSGNFLEIRLAKALQEAENKIEELRDICEDHVFCDELIYELKRDISFLRTELYENQLNPEKGI